MKNFIAALNDLPIHPSGEQVDSAVGRLKTFSYELDDFRAEERMRVLLDLASDRTLREEISAAVTEFRTLSGSPDGSPKEDLIEFLDLLESLVEDEGA